MKYGTLTDPKQKSIIFFLVVMFAFCALPAVASGSQEKVDEMKRISTKYLAERYPELVVRKLEVKYYWKPNDYWAWVDVDFDPQFSFEIYRTATETRDDLIDRLLTKLVRNKYEPFFAKEGVTIDNFIVRFLDLDESVDYRSLKYTGQKIDNFEINVSMPVDTAENLKLLTRNFISYSKRIGISNVQYANARSVGGPILFRTKKFYCAIPFSLSNSREEFVVDESTVLETGARGQ